MSVTAYGLHPKAAAYFEMTACYFISFWEGWGASGFLRESISILSIMMVKPCWPCLMGFHSPYRGQFLDLHTCFQIPRFAHVGPDIFSISSVVMRSACSTTCSYQTSRWSLGMYTNISKHVKFRYYDSQVRLTIPNRFRDLKHRLYTREAILNPHGLRTCY